MGPGPTSRLPSPGVSPKTPTEGDELDAYGGKARVVRLDTSQHPQSPTGSVRERSLGTHTPTSTPSPRSRSHMLPNISHVRGHSATRSQTTPLHSGMSTPQPQVQQNYQLYTHQLFNPGGAPTTQSISPSSSMHGLELPNTTNSGVGVGVGGTGDGLNGLNGLNGLMSGVGIAGGHHDPLQHDFSWMDGFGVGAPMDQFPVVPPELSGSILRAHDAHHTQSQIHRDIQIPTLSSLPLSNSNTITPGNGGGGGSPGQSGMGSPSLGAFASASGYLGGNPGSPDVMMGGVGIGDDVSSWLSGPGVGMGTLGGVIGGGGGGGDQGDYVADMDNEQWQLWMQELQRTSGMTPGYQ